MFSLQNTKHFSKLVRSYINMSLVISSNKTKKLYSSNTQMQDFTWTYFRAIHTVEAFQENVCGRLYIRTSYFLYFPIFRTIAVLANCYYTIVLRFC